MSKKLPYFQFEPSAWLSGDVQFCSQPAQGVFINICAIYWERGCNLTIKQLNKRFEKYPEEIDELLQEEVIINDSGQVKIEFLDEQHEEITARKKRLSEAGKKGYKTKVSQATVKPPLSKAQATLKQLDKIREDKIREEVYREHGHLSITLTEFNKLIDEGFTTAQADEIINKVLNYSKNHKYKSL